MEKIFFKIRIIIYIIIFFIPAYFFSDLIQYYNLNAEALSIAQMKKFKNHKDEYNVVFIGSSFMWRTISPEIFDNEMKKYGIKTSSYNLAAPLMPYGEAIFLLKKINRLKPKNLKWIIIEYPLYACAPKFYNTQKFVYWHDLEISFLCSKKNISNNKTADITDNIKNSINEILLHLKAFLSNIYNKGMGLRIIDLSYSNFTYSHTTSWTDPLLIGYKSTKNYFYYKENLKEGFISLDKQLGLISDRRLYFLNNEQEEFLKIRSELIKRNAVEKDILSDGLYGEIYDRMLNLVYSMNARPVIMVAPSSINVPKGLSVKLNEGNTMPILRLDDPERFPSIYDISRRYDMGHLNALGAKEASVYFANIFYEFIEKYPQ